jgi:hypothetical protein
MIEAFQAACMQGPSSDIQIQLPDHQITGQHGLPSKGDLQYVDIQVTYMQSFLSLKE